MKIYLAHPISGLAYDDIMEYYRIVGQLLELKYELLCPMVAKGFLDGNGKLAPGGYKNPVSTDHAIIERDRWMVTQSDVVFCDFTGSVSVSIGCVMELAWAHQLGKHTVVVLPPKNIHEHAFVKEAADIAFGNQKSAIAYLKELARGLV